MSKIKYFEDNLIVRAALEPISLYHDVCGIGFFVSKIFRNKTVENNNASKRSNKQQKGRQR